MMSLLVLLTGTATAAEQLIDVPFQAPAEVPLLVSARVVEAKGKVDSDDCSGAAEAALAEAAEAGTVVRVVVAPDNLLEAGKLQCRQRVAGDFIASSVVTLTAVVVESGSGPARPPLTVERTVQLATLLGALGGDLEAVSIVDLEGAAWVDLGPEVHPDLVNSGQLDANARAARMYDEYVPQWVSRWAPVLGTVGEVAGAVLTVEVESEDPARKKSKGRELFRFAVPTSAAAAFLSGRLTDEELIASCRVYRAENVRKPVFEPFQMDVIEGVLAVEGEHGQVDRKGLDVEDSDMDGLEDEEGPVEEEHWERQ